MRRFKNLQGSGLPCRVPRASGLRARRRMNQADLIVARIERARQDRGISVAELDRRIDVDRKRLWYVLNGQQQRHVDEMVRLCAVIDD